MDVAVRYQNQFQPYVEEAIRRVGPFVWRQLVREARRQGHNAREAVNNALYRVRDNLADYRDRLASRKRDRSGNIRDTKKVTSDRTITTMLGDDINFSRTKHRLGRTKKRTAADMFRADIGSMFETVYRYQRVSPSLLGPGATPISYGYNSALPGYALSSRVLPFHFMSLTHNPAFNGNTTLGCSDLGLCRATYQTTGAGVAWTGNCGYQALTCQNNNGDNSSFPQWHIEKGVKHSSNERVFHKWTDVRLNLYGSLYYPLKYKVMVVTGLEQDMNFHEFPLGNYANPFVAEDFPIDNDTPLAQFVVDSVRGLVTNPIVGSNTNHNWKGKMRFLYNKTYNVPCLSYGNGSAQAASGVDSTNVKSVNLFLRHDRFRNYGWYSMPDNNTEYYNLPGVGFEVKDDNAASDIENLSDVDREERVYFIITCTCPKEDDEVYNNLAFPWDAAPVPTTEALPVFGSYDIVVRNCFRSGHGDPNQH